ncbi:single-stranded-DNA-specific exonuclease RecJ [Desulfocicer vacuolatum]|nr:single-stranded-DNA-specific exonuclease RecJ [Desulfocicer vacuolatum]
MEWIYKSADPGTVTKISRVIGCHRAVAELLVNRGITTPEAAFSFLNPSFDNLASPFVMKDMKPAVERIYTAVCHREKIMIFGDFDADGITATAILHDFFTHVNAEVSWYIPHRTKEGYSMKPEHIAMAVEQRIDLIITVDCGSDNHDAVDAALKEDMDVIITDHHEISHPFPRAVAIVNPKRQDCMAGLDHLAGVGVAFYLIIALRKHMREQHFWKEITEPNLMSYCDLVAIGTMADMVPLKNENRIFTTAGIRVIQQGKRPGIKALADVSRVDHTVFDSDDISFRIAPRINAAGRMAHARICVGMLTTREKSSAEQTAALLDQLNLKRQQTEKSIVEDIENQIQRQPDILDNQAIVLAHEKWNPGVLGIAASKTARKYFKPVVLISTAATPATGSCRSVGGVDIHAILTQCNTLLEKFGGHVMAAGISIKEKNINHFARLFSEKVALAVQGHPLEKKLVLDCFVEINEITEDFIKNIDRLRPFGTDNPEPLFYCNDLKVISSFIIADKHRKMTLEKSSAQGSGATIEAFQFNIDVRHPLPMHFERIAFRVRMNRFNKKSFPQIIIEAI